jgi:hypothetical protein
MNNKPQTPVRVFSPFEFHAACVANACQLLGLKHFPAAIVDLLKKRAL